MIIFSNIVTFLLLAFLSWWIAHIEERLKRLEDKDKQADEAEKPNQL